MDVALGIKSKEQNKTTEKNYHIYRHRHMYTIRHTHTNTTAKIHTEHKSIRTEHETQLEKFVYVLCQAVCCLLLVIFVVVSVHLHMPGTITAVRMCFVLKWEVMSFWMGLLGVTWTNKIDIYTHKTNASKHAGEQVNEWWSDLNYATLPLMCQCDDTKHIVSFPIFPCLIIHIVQHLHAFNIRSIFNKTFTHVYAHHTPYSKHRHNWFNRYYIQHFVTYCNYIFYLIRTGFSKIYHSYFACNNINRIY